MFVNIKHFKNVCKIFKFLRLLNVKFQPLWQIEKAEAEEANRKFHVQLQDYRVPDVMEYVQEKADLYNLRKAVQSWERKVEIATMALKTHQNTWKKLKADAVGQLEGGGLVKGGVQDTKVYHAPSLMLN